MVRFIVMSLDEMHSVMNRIFLEVGGLLTRNIDRTDATNRSFNLLRRNRGALPTI